MKDYYNILGLCPNCSKAEIHRSYRLKAKEVHPDLCNNDQTAKFLALKEAYEVLSNQITRDAYNQSRRSSQKTSSKWDWDYRSFLNARKDNPESLARLICFDLLHDEGTQAVKLFEEAQSSGCFSLLQHIGREDFMDYAFLLAEVYLEQNSFVKAYRLLRGIAQLEEERPYFRHFFVEVLERMSSIVKHQLPGDQDNHLRITFLNDMIHLSYPPKEAARLRKLLSELLLSIGRYQEAAKKLFEAHELSPRLPGLEEAIANLEELGYWQTGKIHSRERPYENFREETS